MRGKGMVCMAGTATGGHGVLLNFRLLNYRQMRLRRAAVPLRDFLLNFSSHQSREKNFSRRRSGAEGSCWSVSS